MFDFAKHVLGATYVLIFLISTFLVLLVVFQVMPHNEIIGIILLVAGMFASMCIAGEITVRIREWKSNKRVHTRDSGSDDSGMGT
jgi:preprotein translocase subunit SecF